MVYQKIVYLIITFRIFIIPKKWHVALCLNSRQDFIAVPSKFFCTQAQIFQPNKVSVLQFFIITIGHWALKVNTRYRVA